MMCCVYWQHTWKKFELVAWIYILPCLFYFIFWCGNVDKLVECGFFNKRDFSSITICSKSGIDLILWRRLRQVERMICSFQVFNILIFLLSVLTETYCHKYIFYIFLDARLLYKSNSVLTLRPQPVFSLGFHIVIFRIFLFCELECFFRPNIFLYLKYILILLSIVFQARILQNYIKNSVYYFLYDTKIFICNVGFYFNTPIEKFLCTHLVYIVWKKYCLFYKKYQRTKFELF